MISRQEKLKTMQTISDTVKDVNNTIVFIGHSASRTGAPMSLLKIIRWLKTNANIDPVIILGESGPLLDQYQALGKTIIYSQVTVRRINNWFLVRVLRQILKRYIQRRTLKHALAYNNPSCIFNNTGVNGRLVAELKRFFDLPVISRIPELEAFMRRNDKIGGLAEVLTLSDHFIAVSEAVKRNLVQRHGVNEASITVVHGACDTAIINRDTGTLRDQFGIKKTDTLVCGCGTMDWRKGFDLFLQTAHRVCNTQARTDIKFLWIGGPINQSQEIEYDYEVEALRLSRSFYRTGVVTSPSEIFAQSDVFFLSSREDPFPLVMLEASRQALPIVFFKGSGGADEFVVECMGRGVQMLDIPGAAEAILEYADSQDIRRKDGLVAQARSLEFDINRMGSGVLTTIFNLMDQRQIHELKH